MVLSKDDIIIRTYHLECTNFDLTKMLYQGTISNLDMSMNYSGIIRLILSPYSQIAPHEYINQN
jgi:hypothetical protein